MEIEVFERISGETFQSVLVIDTFRSLMINKKYFTADDFQLNISAAEKHVTYLVPGSILLMDSCYFSIDSTTYAEDKDELVVSGVSLFGLMRHRIVWSNFMLYDKPSFICERIIYENVTNPTNANRSIGLFDVSVSNLPLANIQYQNSYGVVRDEIETLCETYNFGIRESSIDELSPGNTIVFYRGEDKSNWIEFTIDNGSLISETYDASNFDEATTALVAGEGEGTARQLVTLQDTLASLDRKELYVDARDLQKVMDTVTLSDAEYIATLTNRGDSKLAEKIATLTLDGTVNIKSKLFIYGVDYNVGDTVALYSNKFKVSVDVTLTEMQKTWDSNGFTLTPTFGQRRPTIIDLIKRK